MLERDLEIETGLSFRERIERGLPVVCPFCGKVDKMEVSGYWFTCPFCRQRVLHCDKWPDGYSWR